MAASDPARRSENARCASLIRWSRKHVRVLKALLWLCTLALPPVMVLALPVVAQAIIACYLGAVPLSLAITWRANDSRRR